MPRKAASRTNKTKARPFPWVLALVLLSALWLGIMVIASVLSYEHKSPVRIENWKPAPAR